MKTLQPKKCISCGVEATVGITGIHNNRFLSRCKKCSSLKSKEYYYKDTDSWRKNVAKWQSDHPGSNRYYTQMNRAKNNNIVVSLTPIEKEWLKFYYDEAHSISKETGIPHEVDHIQPVSKGGAHAPWNLQILTETDNKRKYNKWVSEAI